MLTAGRQKIIIRLPAVFKFIFTESGLRCLTVILRSAKKFIFSFIIICIVLLYYSIACSAEFGEGNDMPSHIFQLIHPGWNLGNTFDALGDETSWGNPITTKELINEIARQGFKSIRIPITWDHRMGEGPDYKIDEAFMERIREVVDWALDSGLYVIINMHHDSHWIFNMKDKYEEVLSRYEAAWKQISDEFKDYPDDRLMFESINEPRFSDDWNEDKPEYFEMLETLNNTFYKIVRNSGGNNSTRFLLLPTLTCSASQKRVEELYKTITNLNDRKVIATIHYYGYWPFSVNIAGATVFDEDVKNDIIQTFDRLHETFISNEIPVIVGEFGLLGFDKSVDTIQQGEKLKFFEFITYYAKEKQLPLMWWDNGQHFDRINFNWRDEQLYKTIIMSLGSRSSTAKTDFIYIKKDAEIKDVDVELNLNGNTLIDIKNGDRSLEKDKDYCINGNILTVKSDFLKSIITNRFGVNATLICKFSAGADWKIDIIYYDTPSLNDMEATEEDFFIPTAFNGTQLKAMESIYKKSKKNTGPNEWTSFKEYNLVFKPANYKIILAPDFLKQLEDGEILLKFYFWSGEAIEYTIIKNGAQIKGISSQADHDKEPDNTYLDEPDGDNKNQAYGENVQGEDNVESYQSESIDAIGSMNKILLGIVAVILIYFIAYRFIRTKQL